MRIEYSAVINCTYAAFHQIEGDDDETERRELVAEPHELDARYALIYADVCLRMLTRELVTERHELDAGYSLSLSIYIYTCLYIILSLYIYSIYANVCVRVCLHR